MATTYRHLWQFLQVDGSTLEEVWYHSGGAISSELNIPIALLDARRDLLMSVHLLQRIRIAAIDGTRNTGQVPIFLPGTIPVASFSPAPPGASMVVQVSGQTGGQKHWWMRGGAAIDFTNGATGKPNPSGAWFKKFAAYLVQASQYGYGILSRANRAINPYVNVVSLAPSGTGQTALTLDSLHAELAKGQQVIIGRFSKKDFPALNGLFTVRTNTVNAAGNTVLGIDYVLPGGVAPGAGVPITGKVRLYTANPVSVLNIANTNLAYLGTRITKGPTSNSRGSRRAARIRQQA